MEMTFWESIVYMVGMVIVAIAIIDRAIHQKHEDWGTPWQ
jgi:hypothetical protein